MRTLKALALVLVWGAMAQPSVAAGVWSKSKTERVDEIVRGFLAGRGENAPSAISAGVSIDGELVVAEGWGEAQPGVPAGPDTQYQIGSLTKQFTAAAVLTLIFVSAFALHPSAATAQASSGRTPAAGSVRELARPHVAVIVVGILGVGLFFGSMLTSLTAFMADHGRPEEAGLVYAAMGVGSAALALGVALFPVGFTSAARWLVFGGLMLAGALALPGVSSVTGMVVALLVIGLGIGPTLVTQYGLGARRSPVGRSATVMTMLGSAVILGQSLASAVTGGVAERWGTEAALALPAAAALVVVLAGAVNARIGERPVPAAAPSSERAVATADR